MYEKDSVRFTSDNGSVSQGSVKAGTFMILVKPDSVEIITTIYSRQKLVADKPFTLKCTTQIIRKALFKSETIVMWDGPALATPL